MVLHALHLCSGYGGFELGLKLAGVECVTVAHVEREAHAAAVLVARMEDKTLDQAPIWSDLESFDGGPWHGRVDLITAGFPCQPFSDAGLRGGVDDDRWLWPHIARIVDEVGPSFVFLENVRGLVRKGLPEVLSDLARLGFDAEWGLLRASDVGAPHKRERVWILGYASGAGRWEVPGGASSHEGEDGRWKDSSYFPVRPGQDVAYPESLGSDERIGPAAWGRRNRIEDNDRIRRMAVTYGTRLEGTGSPEGGGSVVAEETGELADTESYPPHPDDYGGWWEYIAAGGPEPGIRRSTDGRPSELVERLHLLGNGLVPGVAASAFTQLLKRLES